MYDGNLAALAAHDRAADAWLDSRPVCVSCREPIQEAECYDTERGLMCEECAKDYARELAQEQIEDWMSEMKQSTYFSRRESIWKRDTERYV